MEAVILLANSAEQPNGLVYAMGMGWSVTGTPTPPIAVLVFIKVPWDQANMKHVFELTLVDSDGAPFEVTTDDGSQHEPLVIKGEFEVGRPPGLPRGMALDQTMTFSIGQALHLQPSTAYEWRLSVDGDDLVTRAFFVRPEA